MNPQNDEEILNQYDAKGSQDQSKTLVNDVNSPRGDWRDLVTKKFQMGWEDVASYRHSVDLMNSQLDDADEITKLQQGPGKPGSDMLQSQYEAQPWHVRAVADAAGTLPALVDTVEQGVIGGATAAGTVGGITTAATGGNIPAGIAAGTTAYGYGATAGELHSIWEQSAGQMYSQLRLQGVSRNTAKNLSYVFGGINSSLGMLNLKAVTGLAGKAMSISQKQTINKVLQTPFVKQVESNMYSRLGMAYAEHTLQGAAGGTGMAINDQLAKVVAGYIEKNKPDAYTNWDSATHDVATQMISALGASAVLAAGSGVGGFALGKATGEIKGGAKKALQKLNVAALNKLEGKSAQEILQQLQDGLKGQPNPWENPEESHSVQYDDNGNPIIKITTTKEGAAPSPTEVKVGKGSTGQQFLADLKQAPQVIADQLTSRPQTNADIQQELDALFFPEKQQQFPGFQDTASTNTDALQADLNGAKYQLENILDTDVDLTGRRVIKSSGEPIDSLGSEIERNRYEIYKKLNDNIEPKADANIADDVLSKLPPEGGTFKNNIQSVLDTAQEYYREGDLKSLEQLRKIADKALDVQRIKEELHNASRHKEIREDLNNTGDLPGLLDALKEIANGNEGLTKSQADIQAERQTYGLRELTSATNDITTMHQQLDEYIKQAKELKNEAWGHKVTEARQKLDSDIATLTSTIVQLEKQIFTNTTETGTQMKLPLVDWRPLNATETQSRLNEINTNRSTLKREINRLETEIHRKEETGQNAFKSIDRWQKVNQTLDALDSERAVLESGISTTDVQGNNYGRQKIKVLNKLFDKISTQAENLKTLELKARTDKTEAFSKGYKSGAYQTTRAIRRIQQNLKDVARAVIAKKGEKVNQEEIQQIKQMQSLVAGITNSEQAAKVVEAIKASALKFEVVRFNKEEVEARRKVYNKVVRLIENQTIRMSGGKPVSNMPPEVTVKLQTLKGLLKDESSLKVAEYDFEVTHGKTPIDQLTPEDIDHLRILQMARALHTGDELSRNVSAGNIAQWVLDGKNTVRAQKEALIAAKEADVTTALNSMGAQETSIDYLTDTHAKRLKHFYNDIQAGELTWNTLLDRITPTDPGHELTKMLDDTAPRGEYLANKEIATQNLMGFLRDRVPKEEQGSILQRIADMGREKYSVKYNTDKGAQTVVMTKAQMLDASLKYEDTSLHEALREGNKFSLPGDVPVGESFIERINGKLDDTDRALKAGILEFYQDYFPSINKKYKEVHNVDLPMHDNYTPVSRSGYKVEPPFSQDGLQFWSLLPGSAKTRQDSKLPIQLSNPFQAALQHVDQWEYWKAYVDKLRTINNVITDPGVRKHISQEYGSGTMHVMDNFVERFMKNEALPNDPGDSFWSAMQADIAHHALGLRPVTGFMTQLSSGLNYWADYSPLQIAHGVMQTVLHPIESEKVLRSSAILKHRYKEGAGIAMERAMNQGGLFGATINKVIGHQPEVMDIAKYDAINRFIFAGYMQGDAATARLFGAPVYWAERGAGKSHAAALQTVERIAEQTQQSSSVSQTPYNAQNNTVNTFVRMFTQQPIQAVGKSSTYINDFFNSKKGITDWSKLGWRMGMIWLAPGAVLGAIRTAPNWLMPPSTDAEEQDQRKRETVYEIAGNSLLGPLGGLPIFGDIAKGIWFQAAKPLIGVDEAKRADYFSANPLMETLFNNPKDMFKKWSALNKEEDIFKAINLNETDKKAEQEVKFKASAAKTVTSLLGVPGQLGNIPLGVLDRASQGDTVGAALSIGGWSPGALKKRQDTPENIFAPIDLNSSETTSAYDTIQTMLDQIVKNDVKGKKPGQVDTSSKEQMDALIKGITQ